MNSFGQLLTKLRKSHGFSIRGLAATSEVNAGYISRLERGEKTNVSEDVISSLSLAMGISARHELILSWVARHPCEGVLIDVFLQDYFRKVDVFYALSCFKWLSPGKKEENWYRYAADHLESLIRG
jgi:transcriptional regulator with XRE-family HTH domain